MHKPLPTALLAMLFAFTAGAQQLPYGESFPGARNPGMLMDPAQQRLLKLREAYVAKELARIRDSVRSMQSRNSSLTQKPVSLSSPYPKQSGTIASKSLSNSCGVKASFTPSNDTTLYTGQDITFTNTSQNADSYEWVVDVYNHYFTTDYNFVPSVGITPVLLIAHRGDCTDTAVTYVVRNGTAPADPGRINVSYGLPNSEEYNATMVNAKSDGYLLAGVSGISYPNGYSSPYFVRVSESGCILWSKLLTQFQQTYIRSLITTYDSGFVVEVLLNSDIANSYILKLDKNGNILWARNYLGVNGIEWVSVIRELSDHSLMVLTQPFDNKNLVMTKLDEQGLQIWRKNYLISDQNQAVFVDLAEQERIRLCGWRLL